MPTYAYRCAHDHLSLMWLSIHADASEHPTTCPECGDPVSLSVETVTTYAVGERGRHTAISDSTDREWHKDMDAYSRFKAQGVQPRKITGCDKLEATAMGTWHVETGQAHKDEVIATRTEEARAIMRGQL